MKIITWDWKEQPDWEAFALPLSQGQRLTFTRSKPTATNLELSLARPAKKRRRNILTSTTANNTQNNL